MMRCGFVFYSVWLSASVLVARTPLEAPRPAVTGSTSVAGCDACRFLPPPSRIGPIMPVQDGPAIEPRDAVPEPLPPSVDATPLSPADALFDLRTLIELSLPEATDDERRVWLEELRSLPLESARAILSARLGSGLSPDFGGSPVVPEPLDELPDLAPPLQSEPALPQLAPPVRTIRPPTTLGVPDVSETLSTLRQAESVLLHNIANALTPGFKRMQPQTTEAAGAAGVSGIVLLRTFTPGPLQETLRPFDIAIEGAGYLQVRKGDTVALVRGGSFVHVESQELALEIAGEPWTLYPPVSITAESADLVIAPEGVVGFRDFEGAFVETGRVALVRVLDPSRLEPAGDGLLAVSDAAGPIAVGVPGAPGFGTLRQGYLEGSNVDLEAELQALQDLRSQLAAFEDAAPSRLASPPAGDERR